MTFNTNHFTKPAVVLPIAAGMIGGALGYELSEHDANNKNIDNTLFRRMEYSGLGALAGVSAGALAIKVNALYNKGVPTDMSADTAAYVKGLGLYGKGNK